MKRLFANTLFTSIDYLILVVLNILATPILIANFGVDGYGAFVFLSIFSIYGAMSFFELGMEGSLMNYVARFEAADDREKLHNTLTASLAYYMVLGAILAAALFACADIITSRLLNDNGAVSRQTVMTSMTYISVNIFFQFLTIPFTAILQGMRRFVVTKGLNSVMTVLRYLLIITVALMYRRIDVAFGVILILTLLRLTALLGIFVFGLPEFRHFRVHFEPSLLWTLLKYTSLLFINRLVGLIHNNVDKVLIWLSLTVRHMTIYDVVVRPAALLRLVMSILNAALIPEVARRHELNDMTTIKELYLRLVRFAYLILLPILALLFVFMDKLLELWVGADFAAYAGLAVLLLSTYLILPVPSVASTMVVGLERVRQTVWIPIAATVINVVLSVVLLGMMGLAGLLTATLAAEIFAFVPYLRAMQRFLHFPIGEITRPVLQIFGVAAVAGAAYIGVRRLSLEWGAITVIAAAAVFSLNCFVNYRYLLTDQERSFLKERMRAARARMV